MINVNYHSIILLKHYFFFKKICLITQSKLLISVYLRICINDIAICTKVSLFTDLVGNGNFRYKYLENHAVYFVENYMVVKLKYCIIRFYIFYFFKIINYHFNSEYFTFKLVVKLLSALSVNTVLAYRYFWLSVKSIWSFLTLSIEKP